MSTSDGGNTSQTVADAPSSRLAFRLGCVAISVVLLALFAMGLYLAIDDLRFGNERRSIAELHAQFQYPYVHAPPTITLRNDLNDALAREFVQSMRALNGEPPLRLELANCNGVDEFLRQIRGLPGIYRVDLLYGDITKMDDIATLPDLEWLCITTTIGLDSLLPPLENCKKLNRLEVTVYQKVHIAALVKTLPNLQTLGIDFNTNPGEAKLAESLDEFAPAQSLATLWLKGVELEPADVIRLRKLLPNCTVTAHTSAVRGNVEIAPLPRAPEDRAIEPPATP